MAERGGWRGWMGQSQYIAGSEIEIQPINSSGRTGDNGEEIGSLDARCCKKVGRCCGYVAAAVGGVVVLAATVLSIRSATRVSSVLIHPCGDANATGMWMPPIEGNGINCSSEMMRLFTPPLPPAPYPSTSFGSVAPNSTSAPNTTSTTNSPSLTTPFAQLPSTSTPIVTMPLLLSEYQQGGYAKAMNTSVAGIWKCRQQMTLQMTDCIKIHVDRVTQPGNKCEVMLLQGRAEDTGRYQELVRDLVSGGCNVTLYDHRGQGRSSRLLKDSQVGYVGSFQHYVDDLDQVMGQTGFLNGTNPKFILGHSMGGAIGGLWVEQHPTCNLTGLIMVSPMTGLPLGSATKVVVHGANSFLGRGAVNPENYAPGQGPYVEKPYTNDNKATGSNQRYQWSRQYIAQNRQAMIGGACWQWLEEALWGSDETVKGAANITSPVLLLQGQNDNLVDTRSQNVFFSGLIQPPHCENGRNHTKIIVSGGRHELLQESDGPRNTTMKAIFNFINGKPMASAEMQQIYDHEAQTSSVGTSERRARRDAHGSTRKHNRR